MGNYVAPRRDMQFVLYELLHADDEFKELPPYAECTRDVVEQVLEQGAKFASEVLFPLNQVGDVEGCRFEDGAVTTPRSRSSSSARSISKTAAPPPWRSIR